MKKLLVAGAIVLGLSACQPQAAAQAKTVYLARYQGEIIVWGLDSVEVSEALEETGCPQPDVMMNEAHKVEGGYRLGNSPEIIQLDFSVHYGVLRRCL